jgi:hypothetical protein
VRDSGRRGETDRAIEAYTEVMAALDRQFEHNVVKDVAFDEAMAARGRYVGIMLRSRVYLLQAHPRGVRLAGSRDSVLKGGYTLLPRTSDVGVKAEAVLREVGECGATTATYGVVNGDNITLFRIEPGT